MSSSVVTSQSVTSTVAAFRRQSDSVAQLFAIVACYMISIIVYKAYARELIESPWFRYLCYVPHISHFDIYRAVNSEFRYEIQRLMNKQRPICCV